MLCPIVKLWVSVLVGYTSSFKRGKARVTGSRDAVILKGNWCVNLLQRHVASLHESSFGEAAECNGCFNDMKFVGHQTAARAGSRGRMSQR